MSSDEITDRAHRHIRIATGLLFVCGLVIAFSLARHAYLYGLINGIIAASLGLNIASNRRLIRFLQRQK